MATVNMKKARFCLLCIDHDFFNKWSGKTLKQQLVLRVKNKALM